MATMVASQQHQQLWQQPSRRTGQVMHMSPVGMPSMIPTSGAPTTRPYQPNQIELTMPMFPPTSMPNAMTFQPGAYGFDLSAMNHYPVQQPFGINFQASVQQPATYAQNTADIQAPVPLVREARNALPALNRSPPVKTEIPSPVHLNQAYSEGGEQFKMISTAEENADGSITFSTDVDCLMRAIQSKQTNPPPPPPPQPVYEAPKIQKVVEPQSAPGDTRSKARKRYQCSMPNCSKSFYQKTHLEIHTRAHTGVKPFVCKEPSCGQRFSQLGNLKTHERRHTGERPYTCDICGKTFAQRGNVRAHKIVHQQIKPFTCRLDDCGKQFTQLGNLKSHQNKFHASTLRYLAQKFGSIREGDPVTVQDKELWEYFASLYKNSNKGIKGRGKDRRISTVPSSAASSSSFTSTATAMSRHATGGSTQGGPSDRSSRSSSYSSVGNMAEAQTTQHHHHPSHHHQPHSHPAQQRMGEQPPLNGNTYQHHFDDQSNYVFPERKFI